MKNQNFSKLNNTVNSKGLTINTTEPISIFYKKKSADKILYTMVKNGQINSFEAQDYQAMHQDKDFELMFVLQGSLTNYLENQQVSFKAGEGCFLNPQIKHTESLDNNCMVMFINLSVSLLSQLLPELKTDTQIYSFLKYNLKQDNNWQRNYLKFSRIMPSTNKSLDILLDVLQQEIASQKIGSHYLQLGLILRLLSELNEKNHFTLNSVSFELSKDDYLVDQIIHIIKKGYGCVTRQELEEKLHYNPEYMNRLLKERTNLTITGFSQKIKINAAEEFLTTTDLTIKVIAERLEFSSEIYFYHYFKKHVLLSPNAFRQKFKIKKAAKLPFEKY
ncbi:AraC family transcriptional regulator [Companilactobacillus kimchiensis]|nr:AraC family transcriptional regulator [Companilactobacillus kimchiensis]